MEEVTLSLVGSEIEANDVPDVYSFERRGEDRQIASGEATVYRRNTEPGTYQLPIANVELVDMSQGGMCVKTESQFEVNDQVTVYFPPHGIEMHMEVMGRVVWCRASNHKRGGGYEMAIEFQSRRAA